MRRPAAALLLAASVLTAGCAATSPQTRGSTAPSPGTTGATTSASVGGLPFTVTPVGEAFREPWAMTFLPDGSALVTERPGTLLRVDVRTGARARVTGTPQVAYGGQGGLGDVVLGPRFAQDRVLYLSWAEAGEKGTSGAAVGRARLSDDGARLEGLHVIWRQSPKVTGQGHYGHRIAVSPDGTHLFITSGERQKFDPAQDDAVNLGKIVRTGLAGEDPVQWTKGHRNPLGIAFDAAGRLWEVEMGPRGGDELDLVVQGRNYGWPRVSNGSHYDGRDIPDHAPGDGFEAPKAWWNPVISPSGLVIYSGTRFPQWRGDAFVGGLSSQALVHLHLDGETATKADQWDMGQRIREVEQGPDGALWLLEDGDGGRLLRLDPAPR